MQAPQTSPPPHRADMRAVLLRPYERALVAALRAISVASLAVILAALMFLDDAPQNPLRLIRLVTGFCLLPALAVALLRWAYAGRVRVEDGVLLVEQRQRSVRVALSDIVALEPWLVPLPGSGLWLRLRSGARLPEGVQMDDPAVLVDALAAASGQRWAPATTPAAVLAHPSMVYARTKQAAGAVTPLRLALKFPVFALVPTLPLFRVHQLIAYGGVFGEYHQYGLRAYLLAFAVYWATLTVYLLLYAAALRVQIELVALASVLLAPRFAQRVRLISERIAALLYYGGVPVFVILRFIPW